MQGKNYLARSCKKQISLQDLARKKFPCKILQVIAFLQGSCKILARNAFSFNQGSDNSSQATIRPKFQKATIRPKRQFVPSDNSSQATIRPKRQFVPSDNSSQATIFGSPYNFLKFVIRLICVL